MQDGAKYEGEWENGRTNGYGIFYYPVGGIYKGNWKDDKTNENGVYIYNEGVKYDGQWSNDWKEGYGTETWNGGKIYKNKGIICGDFMQQFPHMGIEYKNVQIKILNCYNIWGNNMIWENPHKIWYKWR